MTSKQLYALRERLNEPLSHDALVEIVYDLIHELFLEKLDQEATEFDEGGDIAG